MNASPFAVRLRVAVEPRAPSWPDGDDALGQALADRLYARLARGPVRPSLVLIREDTVQIVDLGPLIQRGGDTHRMIAALAGQEGIQAVAVVGPMVRRHRGRPVARFAGVFVEWPDGRWWGCWRVLGDDGRPMPSDGDDVQRAVDGLSRPGGLGAWFSRARFQGLRAEIRPVDPPPAEVVN